jgi:hypothetical protein
MGCYPKGQLQLEQHDNFQIAISGLQLHSQQIQRPQQRNQTPLIHPISKNETFFLDYCKLIRYS